MTTATVNDNATGVWSHRVGTTLTVVRPGANPHHVIVQRPGERKQFGMPSAWLDMHEVRIRRALRMSGGMFG